MDQSTLAAQEAEETYDCLSKLTNVRQPRYRLLAILGEGPTGRVFKARNTYSNNTVAVKIIDTNDREWVSREGDALFAIKKEVRRVNSSAAYGSFGILEVLDVVPFLDTLWMVSPLCEGGNLKTMMQPLGCLKPVYIETTLRDVARALFWLHNQETFHGNVKAANVLIDERGGLRLCDFDLVSRGEISPSHSDCAYNGSLHWLAPERLEDRHNFHKRQDIWSFGALAYELATGSPPLSSLENESAILEHLATAGPPQLTGDQHCESLRKLIEYCLVIDIDQRPSMNLVFSHAYLSSTSEPASLRDLVETFHDWQSRQNSQDLTSNAMADANIEDQDGAQLEFTLGSPLANPRPDDTNSASASSSADSPGAEHGGISSLHVRGESDGEFSAWSLVDEPSRCSSPFDLQHLVTRTLSFEDLGSDDPHHRHEATQTSMRNKEEGSSRQSNASGIPITVGLSLSQDEAASRTFASDFRSGATNDEPNVGLNMDFNPNFDVFTSEIASSSATYQALGTAHEIATQMPYDPVTDVWSSPHPGTLLYPRPYLWDSPPISPSSSPVRTPAGRPLAFVPGPGLLLGGVLPATTYDQGNERQTLWMDGGDYSGRDDDDDSSTVRLRDSNPVNLEMAATAAPSTPPTTPNQSTQFKGKEPASSPHAWPPFRLASRSTNDASSQAFSPPLTPSLTKPLPPLPKTIHRPATASRHRPSTSGGSSSGRSALHNAPPPVPMIPMPLRRPSVDIFSPVSYDSFGSSFDAQGNYIPHPAPLSPSQKFEFEPNANMPTQRQKERSPAVLRERMIPREAGSCPPRRRKSHPAIGSRGMASSSSSHVPKTSSSSSSSSSSRPAAKFPPRNASFSVFPSARPSTAAAAQSAINARNNLLTCSNSSRDSIASRMPPRRPSEPIPTAPHSFFDYDADEESDLDDFEFPRKNSAAEIKKGVKRLVNSVSANLGDTIRGLETAPLKGLRWMKRSSPSM